MRDLIAAAPSAGSVGCRLCFEDGVIGRPPPHPIWTKRDALRTPSVEDVMISRDPVDGTVPGGVGESIGLSTTVAFLSLEVWAFVLGPLGALLKVLMTLLVRALFLDPDPPARWASALISSTPRGAPAALLPPGRPRPVLDDPVPPRPGLEPA